MRILKATYIVSLNGPIIENGYLYIEDDGTIIHCSAVEPISYDFEVEEYKGILCPGFVNTHCHLELSHMKGLMAEATGLPSFVSQIPTKRNQFQGNVQAAYEAADRQMLTQGIVAVGDISNTTDTLELKKSSKISYHSFVELFGLDQTQADEIFNKGLAVLNEYRSNELAASIVPHAPYSVSPQLLKLIYDGTEDQLMSMHHQETPSEMELFNRSEGELLELFESRGLDMTQQKAFKGSSSEYSLLQFLENEQKILLVHNTCSEQEDIEKIEKHFKNAYWCTCPKANWYIERRLPNYDLWRENKLVITVGTDSLASNHSLSILEELKLIQKHYPHIPTDELLLWACKNGAEALGYLDLGTFAVGTRPGIILIENIDGFSLCDTSKVRVLV